MSLFPRDSWSSRVTWIASFLTSVTIVYLSINIFCILILQSSRHSHAHQIFSIISYLCFILSTVLSIFVRTLDILRKLKAWAGYPRVLFHISDVLFFSLPQLTSLKIFNLVIFINSVPILHFVPYLLNLILKHISSDANSFHGDHCLDTIIRFQFQLILFSAISHSSSWDDKNQWNHMLTRT